MDGYTDMVIANDFGRDDWYLNDAGKGFLRQEGSFFGFPAFPAVGERLERVSLYTIINQDRCQKVIAAMLNRLATDKPLLITLDRCLSLSKVAK